MLKKRKSLRAWLVWPFFWILGRHTEIKSTVLFHTPSLRKLIFWYTMWRRNMDKNISLVWWLNNSISHLFVLAFAYIPQFWLYWWCSQCKFSFMLSHITLQDAAITPLKSETGLWILPLWWRYTCMFPGFFQVTIIYLHGKGFQRDSGSPMAIKHHVTQEPHQTWFFFLTHFIKK